MIKIEFTFKHLLLNKEQYQKWEAQRKSEKPEKGKANNPRAS
jgi:hypothetical protein